MDLILGIVASTIIAIVVYRFQDRVPRPRYAVWNAMLLDVPSFLLDSAHIKFVGVGRAISKVSLCHVLFWNGSRGPLRSSEVAKGFPPTVHAASGEILVHAAILAKSREAAGFDVLPSKDRSSLIIKFDHLNHGDWVCIRMFHTGRSHLQLSGSFVGCELKPHSSPSSTSRAMLIGAAFICVSAAAWRSVAELALAEAGVMPPVLSLAAPRVGCAVDVAGLVALVVFFLTSIRIAVRHVRLPVSMEQLLTSEFKTVLMDE